MATNRIENNLTLMNTDDVEGNIIDACSSAANVVLLTDTNKIYYSGLRIDAKHEVQNHKFVPLKVDKKIVKIGVTATQLITLQEDRTIHTYLLGAVERTVEVIKNELIVDFACNANAMWTLNKRDFPLKVIDKFVDFSSSIGGYKNAMGIWTVDNTFYLYGSDLGHQPDQWNEIEVPQELKRKSIVLMRMRMLNVLVITEDGELWGMGLNERGELGLGHRDIVQDFTRIPLMCGHNTLIPVDIACTIYGITLQCRSVNYTIYPMFKTRAFYDVNIIA
jgi:hypothetical protein